MPVPFRISIGSCAHRTRTGYPFSVPKEESFVLSAYMIKPNGVPPSGKDDYDFTEVQNMAISEE